jgi:hypothetical protein
VEVAAGGDEAIEFKSRFKISLCFNKNNKSKFIEFRHYLRLGQRPTPPAADNETQSKQSKYF